MDLQAQIAAANARKDKERTRALGKKFSHLRTDRQALELVCQAVRGFEAQAVFTIQQAAAWKAVVEAVKLGEKRLAG
jgi:hypothetical protein